MIACFSVRLVVYDRLWHKLVVYFGCALIIAQAPR